MARDIRRLASGGTDRPSCAPDGGLHLRFTRVSEAPRRSKIALRKSPGMILLESADSTRSRLPVPRERFEVPLRVVLRY